MEVQGYDILLENDVKKSSSMRTRALYTPAFRRSVTTIAVLWCFRRILDPANATCKCPRSRLTLSSSGPLKQSI